MAFPRGIRRIKGKRMKKRLVKVLLITGGILILLAAYYFFVRFTGKRIPCIFEAATHLKCPGCGSTRAVMAYSRFDLKEGLRFNYLLPFEAAYVITACADMAYRFVKYGKSQKKNAGMPLWVHIAALSVIIAWWIVRNILKV